MARTGISIQVSNAAFGGVPNVDSNSILFVAGAEAVSTGDLAFSLDTPYLLRSVNDLESLDITELNNPAIYRQVSGFYAPKSGINTTGTILWLVGSLTLTDESLIVDMIRETVLNGFQYRPRNILISQVDTFAARPLEMSAIQAAIDELYVEGFACVAILGDCLRGDIATVPPVDLSLEAAPMVALAVISDIVGVEASVGKIGGFMSTLSVGTSIGDASLSFFANEMYLVDMSLEDVYVNTPCASLSLADFNALGDAQYIFARTRPPMNGLWLNDGSTCDEATNALSTLEATRTLASIVDALRTYFTPFLNGKVPVDSDGDIDSTFKNVVLASARSRIVAPYISSGDISDANITLTAKDNDMIGTRTWEVTLAILPAPTLRWVDGYVFYVKSL